MPWSEAMELLYETLAERERLASSAVFAARALGEVLDGEGRRAEALAHLEAALERFATNPYALYLRVQLGTVLRDEHEFQRALDQLNLARREIAAHRASGDVAATTLEAFDAIALTELGSTAGLLGMLDVCEAQFREVEELAQGLDEVTATALRASTLVYALNALIDFRGANEAELRERWARLSEAETLSPATRAQIEERLAMVDIQRAFLGLLPEGSGERALADVIASGDLKIDERRRSRLFLAMSRLDRGATEEALAELDAVRASLGTGDEFEPQRLFEVSLRARWLTASGASRDERARFLADELRPALSGFLDRTHRGPIQDGGVALLSLDWIHAAFGQLLEYELDCAEDGRGADRALAWLIDLQAAGTFARAEGIAAPTRAELDESLRSDDAALLAWVPSRETTFLFELRAGSLRVHRLDGLMSLLRRASRLEESLLSALRGGGASSDARLSAAIDAASTAFLPEPVRARLRGGGALRVVGLDAFGYVPLEVLRLDPPGAGAPPGSGESEPGRWSDLLGATHAITYLPSIPVGVRLSELAAERDAGSGSVVGFVAAGARPGYEELRLAADELGLDAFGGDAERAVDVATLARGLESARLAHVFCHGVYDAQRIRPAGLLVDPESDGGAWFSDEIAARPWPPAVFVSACGGARGSLRRGDDGAGRLRTAFFRGGALAVATATMPLELDAAADFARDVHAELARGVSIAEALRLARRAARPAAHGVHPIHAHLLHVWGAAEMRIAPASADDGAGSGTGARTWLGAGAVAAMLALVLAARRRARGGRAR